MSRSSFVQLRGASQKKGSHMYALNKRNINSNELRQHDPAFFANPPKYCQKRSHCQKCSSLRRQDKAIVKVGHDATLPLNRDGVR